MIAWVSGLALLVHVFVTWLLVYKLKVGFVGIAITFGFSWDGCFISSIKGIWTGMLSRILVQTLLLAIMTIRCDWEEQCTCHLFIHFLNKLLMLKALFLYLFCLFFFFLFSNNSLKSPKIPKFQVYLSSQLSFPF